MPTTYAIPDGRTVMAATLYTGTGAAQTISNAVNGVSFQPDWVWQKARQEVANHRLVDSVRGVDKVLYSSSTAAEATTDGVVDSFNSNGFTGGGSDVVTSSQTAVAWQWKAGGTAVTNTSGSITSSVSAGTTQGFSVCTFTTPASGTCTFGHGLGVAPSMVITKIRNAVDGWQVWHTSIGATQYIQLNTTAAVATNANIYTAVPTSTVVNLGVNWAGSYTVVSYCFAPIAGYSAFGSYTGNGSADGPFVYLGFRPAFVLTKRTDSTGDWQLMDDSRNTFNVTNTTLFPNLSQAEATGYSKDFLSNGFKIRDSGSSLNASGGTYIYAAFAENPFKYANAR